MEIERGNWIFTATCDWLQLRHPRGWNWLNFRLLQLEVEWDRALGMLKLDAALLGFQTYVAYTYDRTTPMRRELDSFDVDDWLSGTQVSVPHDEYVAMKADADKWRGVPVESLGREKAP